MYKKVQDKQRHPAGFTGRAAFVTILSGQICLNSIPMLQLNWNHCNIYRWLLQHEESDMDRWSNNNAGFSGYTPVKEAVC